MGHGIVGQVADRRLTPAARKECRRLLGGQSLAQVSSWADDVRDDRPGTYNWHFTDIPRNASTYDPARDCKPDPAKGDCVVNEALDAQHAAAERPRYAALASEKSGCCSWHNDVCGW